jgi:hypothetical protein
LTIHHLLNHSDKSLIADHGQSGDEFGIDTSSTHRKLLAPTSPEVIPIELFDNDFYRSSPFDDEVLDVSTAES